MSLPGKIFFAFFFCLSSLPVKETWNRKKIKDCSFTQLPEGYLYLET
jgi:hypothetical protein